MNTTQERMTGVQLTRACTASLVGTSIEWYDVSAFGILLPLYLAHVFFPSSLGFLLAVLVGNVAQVLSAVMRTPGAMFFGHLGDRVGRKHALFATLLMSGVACALIGFLPTYARIGIWAPAIAFTLRMCMGFALGGEWGGAVTLTLEWANDSPRRGLLTALPQLGLPIGGVLASLVILATQTLFGGSEWAWRVPFLASIPILAIGAYVRLAVLDTPTFSSLQETRRIARHPVTDALRRQPAAWFGSALSRPAELAPAVVIGSFFLTYGVATLHLSRETILLISIGSTLAGLGSTLLWARFSDRFGRRRTVMAGMTLMVFYVGLAYFQLLNSGDVILISLAQAIGLMIVGVIAGPGAALVAEQFSPRWRYSGTAWASGLGATIGVASASILPTLFLRQYHDTFYISVFVMVLCVIGVFGVGLLKERGDVDVSVEYDAVAEVG
jgi:MFS family permease